MKKYILLCMMVLLLPFIYAGSYNWSGYEDFEQGRGSFNANLDILTDIGTTSRGLSNGRSVPIVSDLDGDGSNEIIVIDDTTVRLYDGDPDMAVLGSNSFGSSNGISNVLAFDIDGEGSREILFAVEETDTMYIYRWDGTSLLLNNSYVLGLPAHTEAGANSGQYVIQCREENDCLIVWTDRATETASFNTPIYHAQPFNSTALTGSLLELYRTASASSHVVCMPKIRTMDAEDLTGDGDKEYIVSAMVYVGSGTDTDQVQIHAIDVTASVPTEIWEYSLSMINTVTDISGTAQCSDNVERFFTSPTVFDHSDDHLGREILVGFASASDQYQIQGITPSGANLGVFPSGFDEGEGELISNPFKAHIDPTSDGNDVCVIGYDASAEDVTMICHTETGSGKGLFQTFEYTADVSGLNYNVTTSFLNQFSIAHSTQQSNALSSNTDLSEVINPFGIYSADFDECSSLANCDDGFVRLFSNVCTDSFNMAIDMENIGSTDLLCMTTSEIVYIDDLLSNQPATVTQVSFDPCITDTIIKVNETLKITVEVTDGEQSTIPVDPVSQRITAYKDTDNEFISLVENTTSGGMETHFIPLNQTGNNFILTIEGWDSANPTEIDTVSQTFTVGNNGAETGTGQICTLSFVTVDDEETETGLVNSSLLTSEDDNAGIQLVSLIKQLTGFGGTLAWLLIMVIVGIMLYMSPTIAGVDMTKHFSSIITFIFFIEIVLLIFGVLIGAVSIAFVITLFVLIISGLAIYISKLFQSSPN